MTADDIDVIVKMLDGNSHQFGGIFSDSSHRVFLDVDYWLSARVCRMTTSVSFIYFVLINFY